MAVPRAFISSTCYDLSEVRDRLVSFCDSFGFETALSERGDVFYHPDLHTHESCVSEISNCQIFILIIGGRFGGKYKIDPSTSITNAEFLAAKELGLPVFTFVKDGVLNDHNTFQKNRDKVFVNEIDYPSIEKQEYAKNIFQFIDGVRLSDTNNGFFGFTYAKDIEVFLRKQLAGMFFDFLSNRNISSQLQNTNDAVSNLAVASKKIEELVKTIYRQVDSVHADNVISKIDDLSTADELFSHVSNRIDASRYISNENQSDLISFSDNNLIAFLMHIDGIDYISEVSDGDGRETGILGYKPTNRVIVDVDGDLTNEELKILQKLENSFKAYLRLSNESKEELLAKYVESSNK
jgi:hypothetical protein